MIKISRLNKINRVLEGRIMKTILTLLERWIRRQKGQMQPKQLNN